MVYAPAATTGTTRFGQSAKEYNGPYSRATRSSRCPAVTSGSGFIVARLDEGPQAPGCGAHPRSRCWSQGKSCAPTAPPMCKDGGFQRTPADRSTLRPGHRQVDKGGSTMLISVLQAAGMGFEPTSDLDDHCRFSRPCRFGSGRTIAGGE